MLPEERGRDDERRQDRHRREREPPVEEEEDDRRADEGERVLDEARDAVGDELVERLDVVRQAADDHAGAVPLVEAEREPLEVAEERVAQVGEDALARPAGEVRLRGGGCDRAEAGGDEERDDPRRALRGRCRGSPWSIASFARYGGASEIAVAEQEQAIASAVRALYGFVRRASVADSPRGRAPRPVVDLARRARCQVAAGLPDPHATVRRPAGARPRRARRSRARAGRARRSRGRRGSSPSSSSCVPRAAIAPASSTTISSASEIVESRCAMMIVVRLRIASRSPCLICDSVVASTDAVASSRIEHARVDDRARARSRSAGAARPRA